MSQAGSQEGAGQPEKVITVEDKIASIKVDRSAVEKEQQDQLIAAEVEKRRLNEELSTLRQQIADAEVEKEGKELISTEDLQQIKDKLEEKEGVLQEIAMAKFNEEKTTRIDQLKELGMEEEKLKEIDEKIQTPEDLDNMDWALAFYAEQLTKAQEQAGEGEGENGDGEGNGEGEGDEGGGEPVSTPDSVPKGSVVSLPATTEKKWVYPDAKQAIDDLYKKLALGGEDAKEAERLLNEYWKRFIPTIKKYKFKTVIIKCPNCDAGIEEGSVCPYCGFDPAKDFILPPRRE